MKFLIDMPLSPSLADWLRSEGHDAVHASALGLGRASDPEILERAVTEPRVVVTADLDHPRLIALSGAAKPGLVLFRGGDWSDIEVIHRTQDLVRAFSTEDLADSVLVVERDRIRRRRLPLQ